MQTMKRTNQNVRDQTPESGTAPADTFIVSETMCASTPLPIFPDYFLALNDKRKAREREREPGQIF
jgi:hypothetical protein